MEMVKLSVVIVTYKSDKIIDSCLSSLLEFSDIDDELLEIIIVDNSPVEDFLKLSTKIKLYPKVKLLHNGRNGGYGQGNNIGISHASGEIIAIMNPDIIHTEPLFKVVVREFANNRNLGMLGFKQYGGKNMSFYFRQEFQDNFSYIRIKLFNKFNFFDVKRMYLSGAYFFTTRTHFESIGFFDEKFFLYCEESDITIRYLQKNLDIKFIPDYSYLHDIDGRDESSLQNLKWLLESVSYYCNKYSFDVIRYLRVFKRELFYKRLVFRAIGKGRRSRAIKNQIDVIDEFIETVS